MSSSIIIFFRFLSEPIVVLTLPLSTLRKGSANNSTFALPPIEVELEVERGGVAHAVCYWYRVTMVDPGSALLSDSSITLAIKSHEMKNIQKHKHKYENNLENANNNKNKNFFGYENKYRNEKEEEKEYLKEKEKESNDVLNEMFPYTLDTGPYGTERLSRSMGKADCHIDGSREGGSREGGDERNEGRERKGNEENTHLSTSQSHPPPSSSSSTSFSSSSSPPSSTPPFPSPSSSHTGLPSHYRQAATLLKEAVAVRAEDTVLIEVGIDICFGVLCRVISHFT